MRKLQDILTDARKWTQKANARDVQGDICLTNSKQAASWCLSGALTACDYSYSDTDLIWHKINQYLMHRGYSSAIDWNDSPDRTFQDIRDLVTTLDI